MNKWAWKIGRSVQNGVRKVIKRVQGLFFQPSIELLKKIDYTALPSPIRWGKVAGKRKIHVEIGSGHGEVLLANDPQGSIIIGYEIKSRFFRLSQRKTRRRDDIFIYKGSGYESLQLHYDRSSIDAIYILFPDPWHKKKHAKRRPLTQEFFLRVAQKLKSGGKLLMATDWTDYAEFIATEAQKVTEQYKVTVGPYDPAKFGLPITHYHQKWARKGRTFTATLLEKK